MWFFKMNGETFSVLKQNIHNTLHIFCLYFFNWPFGVILRLVWGVQGHTVILLVFCLMKQYRLICMIYISTEILLKEKLNNMTAIEVPL